MIVFYRVPKQMQLSVSTVVINDPCRNSSWSLANTVIYVINFRTFTMINDVMLVVKLCLVFYIKTGAKLFPCVCNLCLYDSEEDYIIFSVMILQECFLYLLSKEGSKDVAFVQFLPLVYYYQWKWGFWYHFSGVCF